MHGPHLVFCVRLKTIALHSVLPRQAKMLDTRGLEYGCAAQCCTWDRVMPDMGSHGDRWLEQLSREGRGGAGATMSLWCVLAAKETNRVVMCIKHSIASQSKEVILLQYLILIWPHLEYHVHF